MSILCPGCDERVEALEPSVKHFHWCGCGANLEQDVCSSCTVQEEQTDCPKCKKKYRTSADVMGLDYHQARKVTRHIEGA